MLGDRKDPTWYGFLRYRDIGLTIEVNQFMIEIKIKHIVVILMLRDLVF
jgi:hypothetical protein